jgi:hypothetical protein
MPANITIPVGHGNLQLHGNSEAIRRDVKIFGIAAGEVIYT